MIKMKKIISSLLIVCFCISALMPFTVVESSAAGSSSGGNSIAISRNKLQMTKGTSEKLQIVATESSKSKIKKKIEWSSSNNKVAKVNKYGKVMAKKDGKATITAKVLYNGTKKSYTCKVTVYDKWAKIHESNATYKETKYSIRLYAHYKPYTLTGKLKGKNYINQIRFDVKKGSGKWKAYCTKKTGAKKYSKVEDFLKNYGKSVYDEYIDYIDIRLFMGVLRAYAENHKNNNGKIRVNETINDFTVDYKKKVISSYYTFVMDQFSLSSLSKNLIATASPAKIAFLLDIESAMSDMNTMSNNILRIVKDMKYFSVASDYLYGLNGDRSLGWLLNDAGKNCKNLYSAIVKLK